MKRMVKEEDNLFHYLEKNTDYSKKKLKSLLKYRNVTVNQKVVTAYDTPLKKGQIVEITKERKETKIGTIPIIYEDQDYLVVNKPSGMLTISTEKEKNRTLYHQVREYIKTKQNAEKIYIVHRLDRETSGLVLFCKDENLRNRIQENWEQVAIKREYRAVVEGILEKKNDCLVSYLKENKIGKVYIANHQEGKKAITNYEVMEENQNSLLKIEIQTGRKNQIRVQLSEIGHPIIGDNKYGGRKAKRFLLCANHLEIKDPRTHKIYSFEINTPREFYRNLS